LTFALDTALAGAAAAASSAALRPRLAWALGTIFDGLRQAAVGPEGDAVRSLVSQRADAAVALACTLTDDMDDKVRYRRCHALLWCNDRLGIVGIVSVRIEAPDPVPRRARDRRIGVVPLHRPARRPARVHATVLLTAAWDDTG